ncbi:MAG: C40 family peptidase [Clostridia bacterium]|nr:C40 family peptidase [Clostridia bacterium]
MNKFKTVAVIAAALATGATFAGCAAANDDYDTKNQAGITEQIPNEIQQPEENKGNEIPVVVPKALTVSYLNVTSDGVNIRSGAGTNYSSRGTAEKSTMYALNDSLGGWYKTGYKNNSAYISSKYCEVVEMKASDDKRVEAVIKEGTKLLGTTYVYGAVRYHDGNGHKLSGFNINSFDCSSLMQYIFYTGANVNLQMNTRTQIYQGKTVKKSELKRGDLMFFTNASRKNLSGVERVGHVALYLGDNWILHTASDYAKIEQISTTRWSYFIQGQRVI